MERQPISSLYGSKPFTIRPLTAEEIEAGTGGHYNLNFVAIVGQDGRIAALVARDDLYDADGNNFWQDC